LTTVTYILIGSWT